MVKIKQIDFEKFRIKFSAHKDDFLTNKDFLKSNRILKRFGLQNKQTFIVDKQTDYVIRRNEDQKKKFSKLQPRKINYSKFKNVPLSNALEQLQNLPNGSFLFRPSSKGNYFLNLTWKI